MYYLRVYYSATFVRKRFANGNGVFFALEMDRYISFNINCTIYIAVRKNNIRNSKYLVCMHNGAILINIICSGEHKIKFVWTLLSIVDQQLIWYLNSSLYMSRSMHTGTDFFFAFRMSVPKLFSINCKCCTSLFIKKK